MSILRTGVYVDDFLCDSSSLPQELCRFLSTMRELDERSQNLQNQIHEQSRLMNRSVGFDEIEDGHDSPNLKDLKNEILSNHEKNLNLCTEKVVLAKQAYDLVELHLKRLNEDLSQFEQDLRQDGKIPKPDLETQPAPVARKRISYFPPPSRRLTESRSERDRLDKTEKDEFYLTELEPESDYFSVSPGVQRRKNFSNPSIPDSTLENEPTYCICGQVSYGDMIACDSGENCKEGEWFHYGCVGLGDETKLIRGQEWFCPACRGQKIE